MRITLEDIFNIPSAVIYYPERFKSVTSVSIDTRTIKKNSIFVAIKGKNFDGHEYVFEAIKKGAKAIIVSNRKLNNFEKVDVPIISVRNTLDAYAELARIWREKHPAKVISITGSNGKTTTKEMLGSLLSTKYKVHKTLANNNNQIGVPLTILSTPKNADFIVLEHGTNHFGEIEYTSRIATPDFSLITNIGTSHTKYLKSKEKILEEKSCLFKYTRTDGTVFINNDDALLKDLKQKYKNSISFGFKGKVNVKGRRSTGKNGSEKIKVSGLGNDFEISIPLLGETNSQNFLAAITVAKTIGISKQYIRKAVKLIHPVNGRLNLISKGNHIIIDDTYNSNPESVSSAIKVLDSFKGRDKIIVLGDMFELGEKSEELHRKVGQELNVTKINRILTIGKNSKFTHDSINKKEKQHFTKRVSLSNYLKKIKFNDSVILIKGSRGMKMEDFVNVIESRVA